MVSPHHFAHWYPTAAYLYVLGLDTLALAWEYLRRHPDYRLDWLRRARRSDAGHRWGLRLLEDPALDARDAHPAWLPGHKHLLHDGKRLALIARSPGQCLRFALAPGLEDGMAVAYAHHGGAAAPARGHAPGAALADARPRPSHSALLELHTLQALDAALTGASLRDVAEGLFGVDAAAGWYSDGGLRSKVRRLTRRGDALMRGGYRRLAQLAPLEKGRFEGHAKRP
jgi:hypothetical protein